VAPAEARARLYPDEVAVRIFLTHTRPEALLGVLEPLHTGPRTTGLGFANQGGTLSVSGLFFVNRATWAHAVEQAARLLDVPREHVLTGEELAALDGKATPEGVIIGGQPLVGPTPG
jgi:phosphoketolase